MSWKEKSDDSEFRVVCTWCGVVIRRAKTKDSQGMCLKCYARMLGEHGHSHERDDGSHWASDR